jgi:hypothetical protein
MRETQLRLVPAAPPSAPPSGSLALRLAVHDLSRIEWIAQVPLPSRGDCRYEIDFTFEVPANIYSAHNVWDHKQSFTRLTSPSEEGELHIDRGDIDELRRDTLGVAHRLKTLREKFERDCNAATLSLNEALAHSLGEMMEGLLGQATSVVAEMRRCLRAPPPDSDGEGQTPPEVSREWELADEFLSHQLLDFLAAAQKGLDELVDAPAVQRRDLDLAFTERVRDRLAEALAEELEHRQEFAFLNPHADAPRELAEFVERGSRLKKHFQGVLFLDVQAYMVDARARNWTGIAAASLAAAMWVGYTLLPISQGTRAGLGLGTFTVLFAAAYALKDRVKELARLWLSGELQRLYGQRAVTLRLPDRVDRERRVVVEARETFDCEAQVREDALNRTLGKTHRVMALRYHLRAEAHASAQLDKAGIHSLKHIFRYDMSPIFSRLDNAVRPVPVLDRATRRVCFADAPKEYRVPVRLQASLGRERCAVEAELVVSKRGVERLENLSEQ